MVLCDQSRRECMMLPSTPARPHVRVAGLQTKFWVLTSYIDCTIHQWGLMVSDHKSSHLSSNCWPTIGKLSGRRAEKGGRSAASVTALSPWRARSGNTSVLAEPSSMMSDALGLFFAGTKFENVFRFASIKEVLLKLSQP
jgi:hypothetical protein